jgi:hypothetical protein
MRTFLRLAALAMAVAGSPGAAAAGESDLREEASRLRRQVEALETQESPLLEGAVRDYLDANAPRSAAGAEPAFWSRMRIDAEFVSTFLATVGAEVNSHAAGGGVDIDFVFDATENLGIFARMTAETTSGRYDGAFGSELGFAPATVSGAVDGIGVDGTVSTSPGSVAINEAGIDWRILLSDRAFHLRLGRLDPRNYFGQTAFTEDSKREFLNNAFDDPTALSFPTNAANTAILGIHAWGAFGEGDSIRVDAGWFSPPGSIFDRGVAFWQVAWRRDLLEREMNVRLYGQFDTTPSDMSGAIGLSADWWATEKIGVFFRVTLHDNQHPTTGETNQVDVDWTLGAVAKGLVPSRPGDTCGIAWALLRGPVSEGLLIPGAPQSHESIVEAYYRFVYERSGLEVTPLVQILIDPGAGAFLDDVVVLAGVRIVAAF